ncbi:MAG: hypothetical protein H0T54_01380 [Geodermatophilaceae bacterium]|nr:hypothetical protein [Geodermatophilaceae bacterium]
MYETGFEPRGFVKCDERGERFWQPIRLPPGVDARSWPGTGNGPYTQLHYVRWRGQLEPRERGMTSRPRHFIVTEVLEVRAAERGDCPGVVR